MRPLTYHSRPVWSTRVAVAGVGVAVAVAVGVRVGMGVRVGIGVRVSVGVGDGFSTVALGVGVRRTRGVAVGMVPCIPLISRGISGGAQALSNPAIRRARPGGSQRRHLLTLTVRAPPVPPVGGMFAFAHAVTISGKYRGHCPWRQGRGSSIPRLTPAWHGRMIHLLCT
jgi:hypothetical protein